MLKLRPLATPVCAALLLAGCQTDLTNLGQFVTPQPAPAPAAQAAAQPAAQTKF